MMQERGAVRQDINTRAIAFVLDALTPSILDSLSSPTRVPLDEANKLDQLSFDEVVETIAELCDRLLTPKAGANLEAGKALMRRGLEEAQVQLTTALSRRREDVHDDSSSLTQQNQKER